MLTIPIPGGAAVPGVFAESDLAQLLDFIAGRGVWRHFGRGITTHPGGGPDERAKHAMCEELERRGLVVRRTDRSPEHVCWEPG